MTVRYDGIEVTWYGYATLRIETPEGSVAYVDPGRYGVLTGEWTGHEEYPHPPASDHAPGDADLVCVTHGDHYDADGISRVASDDATMLVHEAIDPASIPRDREAETAPLDSLPGEVRPVNDAESLTVESIDIETVPMYNRPDGPNTNEDGTPQHRKGNGCGFVLTLAGTHESVPVFWPGDSDALDEHEALDVSVFCPPIGRSFTMDRHGAAALAAGLDPELVCPIHYNTFEALRSDSAAFAADVAGRGVPVVLDEAPEREQRVR